MEPVTSGFTLTHLEGDYIGLHDANNVWAKVYNAHGDLIESLRTPMCYDDSVPYMSNWTKADYIAEGYALVDSTLTTITDNEVF